MTEHCDVLILGGGPAGLATAIALAREGRSVVVLERSHYDQVRIGETLPPVARVPLARLDESELLQRGGHAPAPGIVSAWGEATLYEEAFIFNPYGHGWHLDRRRFDAELAIAAAVAGAECYRGAQLKTCVAASDGWQIEFCVGDATQRLSAAFVVDATGRSAWFARRQGGQRLRYDRLVGVVALLSDDQPASRQDTRTLVEAGPDGWWYSASLPDGRLIAAYMTDADLLPRGLARLTDDWTRQLEHAPHTRARLNAQGGDYRLKTVVADSAKLERAWGERWLAVGDAAMTYDPLSSFGVCKALNTGLAAAQTIAQWISGDADALRAYAESVNSDFQQYLAMRALHYGRERRWPGSRFCSAGRSNGKDT